METTIANRIGGSVFSIIGVFALSGAWKVAKMNKYWSAIGLGFVGVIILLLGLGMFFSQGLSNTLKNYAYVTDAYTDFASDPNKPRDPQQIDQNMSSSPSPFDTNSSKQFGNYNKSQTTDLASNAALVNFNTSNSYDGAAVSGTVAAGPNSLTSNYNGYEQGPVPANIPSDPNFTTTEKVSEPSSFKLW